MGVPEGWEVVPIADLVEGMQYGTSAKCHSDAAGLPVLRIPNVVGGRISRGAMKFTELPVEEAKRYEVREGDVLIVRTNGNPDYVARSAVVSALDGPLLFASYLIRLKVNAKKVLPVYLHLALSSEHTRERMRGAIRTSAGNYNINTKGIAGTQIEVPPLPEQRKIAAILSSVDEAIEATQAVIDQVQVVKKGLMQELLTKGLPGRHKKFKQTELGQIPEEWEVVELGDVLEKIEAGWSPRCEQSIPGPEEWGVLKVSAVSGGRYKPSESKRYTGDAPPREEIEVQPGDVLLSRASGVLELVGKTVFVESTPRRLMLSDKTLRLRPNARRISNRFLHNVMSHGPVREQLLLATGGSHMRNVSQAALKKLRIPVPALEEQRAIERAGVCSTTRIREERAYLNSQQGLKQALMSVLLTGELRVQLNEDASP